MKAPEQPTTASCFDTGALFQRILVPVAFDDASQCALAEALELRKKFGSTVHLFHFAEQDETGRFLAGTGAGGTAPGELVTDAEARMRRFVTNVLPGHEGEVSVHANVGADVADGVADEAKRVDATLVVVGRGFERHLLRSATERIVQKLTCPVLLIGEPEEPEVTERESWEDAADIDAAMLA